MTVTGAVTVGGGVTVVVVDGVTGAQDGTRPARAPQLTVVGGAATVVVVVGQAPIVSDGPDAVRIAGHSGGDTVPAGRFSWVPARVVAVADPADASPWPPPWARPGTGPGPG